MSEILRVKINWTGAPGGPGFTNLYFRDFTEGTVTQAMADAAATKVQAFATALHFDIPTSITLQVDPTVDRIEETTGELQGFFQTNPGAAIAGSAPGAFSAASGGCIAWSTNGVRRGRRIRGRTFVVPLAGTCYDGTGTLSDQTLIDLRTAATNLRSGTGNALLGVWARPTSKGATDGVWYIVQASSVKDKVAILTSRRD